MEIKTISKRSRMLFAVLPVIMLLCVGIWVLQRATPRVPIESNDGVYDLTGIDLRHTMKEPLP